ncbi:MAG: hypothetical protein PHY64_11510 [Eubacteriales bacterium]|nr:hypothetical protein [Eubacteriales bacterium]
MKNRQNLANAPGVRCVADAYAGKSADLTAKLRFPVVVSVFA